MQLHPSVDSCMVCSSICTNIPRCDLFATVHHQPFNKIIYQYSFNFSCNFPALYFFCFISTKHFSKSINFNCWTILTNISKSNSNYIIYMYYMSIAIACGVDVCTVHHQTLKKIHICINIHYPHTISLTYINYIFFEIPIPSSAGGFLQTSFPLIQT